MAVGAHEQHCSPERLEPYRARAAQIVHVLPAAVAPGVEIEGLAAVFGHAMGLHDVPAQCDQGLDDIRRIFNDVDVEPEHPILIAECAEEKVIARTREDRAPLNLKDR